MKKKLLLFILLMLLFPNIVQAKDKCYALDGDGKTFGNEIVCDSEHFYVLGSTEDSIRLLSKYNLYTGIIIYREQFDKVANEGKAYNQICNEIAENNNAIAKIDDFYTSEDYCFYYKTIDDSDGIYQSKNALSAHWDKDDNYLYPQVGDIYMESYNDYTVSSNPVVENTSFYDFTIPGTSTYNVGSKLKKYKNTLNDLGITINNIELLPVSELYSIIQRESNKSLPLKTWGDEVASQTGNYNIQGVFGGLKEYIPEKYSWLYSTTYWNSTIFKASNTYNQKYYVFTAEMGKLCGAGFAFCAPTTTLGCGIRPVITIPTDELDQTHIVDNTCDINNISLDSISLVSTNGEAKVLKEASIQDNRIKLSFQVRSINDSVKYKLTVTNNSNVDYYVDSNSFRVDGSSLDYEIQYDGTDKIEPHTSKEIYLLYSYNNYLDESKFENGIYSEKNNSTINITEKETLNIPNTIKYASRIMIIILIISLVIISIILYKNDKKNKATLSLIIALLLIPIYSNASCMIELKVNSNIEILKKNEYELISGDKDNLVIGDVIRLAGKDDFYVVTTDENTVTLLAKYNLYAGACDLNGTKTIIPNSNPDYLWQAKTKELSDSCDLPFSGSSNNNSSKGYWYGKVGIGDDYLYQGSYNTPAHYYEGNFPYVYSENYVSQPNFQVDSFTPSSNRGYSLAYYVTNYKKLLEENGYKIKEARLLSYDEASSRELFNCDTMNYCTREANKTFICETNFWLGSANSDLTVWYISQCGIETQSFYDIYYGVRPVIVIEKSMLNFKD